MRRCNSGRASPTTSMVGSLTIRVLAGWGGAFSDLALVLEVNVPALCLTVLVRQRKSEDALALLHRILSFGLVGL